MGIREETVYEGGPHIGDLITSILIGFTVIGIPITVAAVIRALWVRYRITDRRVSVIGGWMGRNRTDIIYSEIIKIAKAPRGIGLWGDMVLTVKNGSRLELRAVPRFRELYDYMIEQVSEQAREASEIR
ncbi:MAG: PH domain-containing protein [Microcoleaceae cyanobacterium]